jgi:hypothetical protein
MASFVSSAHVKWSRLVAVGHSGGATALYDTMPMVFINSDQFFLLYYRSSMLSLKSSPSNLKLYSGNNLTLA